MLKALLSIIAVLVLLAVGVVLYASTRPDTFQVVRSISVNAPPEKIYPLLEDFRRWRDWSPFEKLDPELKRAFSGAEKGQGAVYEWEGTAGQAGTGRMEIIGAESPNKILIKLDFSKPIEARNIAEFTIAPEGGGSKVTWDMHGPTPLVGKVFHLFVDFDKMVGGSFEQGLAEIKSIAER